MRIHTLKILGLGFVAAAGLSTFLIPASAQQQLVPIVMMPLKDIYVSTGGAGPMNSSNDGIIMGKTSVIVVDVKLTPESEKQVMADIAKLTPKPVKTAIITHSDNDHAYGLAALPKGIEVVAQQNARKEMEESLADPQGGAPKDYLPTHTVDKKESITIDGVRFQLLHVAPAHTSGDLIVYLPDKKIVFAGDLINSNLAFPLIHLEKHGSSEGWVAMAKAMLELDADTYVPGHGAIETKADVQSELAKVEDRRAQVKAMVDQGKSLDEIREAFGETNIKTGPGSPGSRLLTMTQVVYRELTGK